MSDETALTVVSREDDFLPLMSLKNALARREAIAEFASKILKEKLDYGPMPGGSKPTLLKPGAEKLAAFFGLAAVPLKVSETKDYTGEAHGGEAFFEFEYRYTMLRGDRVIAAADGCCNSWEKKYRWRTAGRACPACGAAAIKRSKYPPRDNPTAAPGWYCHDKSGGCGANFDANDDRITAGGGLVPNPDAADLVNTVQKMAQKRAYVAAVLLATNASDYFTQDLEDHQDDTPAPAPPPQQQRPQQRPQQQQQRPAPTPADEVGTLFKNARAAGLDDATIAAWRTELQIPAGTPISNFSPLQLDGLRLALQRWKPPAQPATTPADPEAERRRLALVTGTLALELEANQIGLTDDAWEGFFASSPLLKDYRGDVKDMTAAQLGVLQMRLRDWIEAKPAKPTDDIPF